MAGARSGDDIPNPDHPVSTRKTMTSLDIRLFMRNNFNLCRDSYEINPAVNGGLNFRYNDVVRKKHDRHLLHAGDCEECREVRVHPRTDCLCFDETLLVL
jgi:hypothetical protein